MLSIVIPIRNAEPAILPLYDRLTAVLEGVRKPYEILFIDDASSDRSFDLLANLVETDSHLKVLRLRRNFGRSAALAAGFDEAQGEIIVSLDGDLRHDPEDIPLLLEKLENGYDIACGWQRDALRVNAVGGLALRVSNWMMKRASGVDLHDFDTNFRAYRSEVLKEVNLYGKLYRFLPALAGSYGARIAEVPIRTVPQRETISPDVLDRVIPLFFDTLTIGFLLRYLTRPMHFFGKWGLGAIGLGTVLFFAALVEKIAGRFPLAGSGSLVLIGGMLWCAGLMLFSTGLISEILMRTYFESQGRRIYAIREVRCRREQLVDGAR